MVSHVVLMKPRAELSVAERDELLETFKRATRAIPMIRGVRVGRRVRHNAGYEASSPDAADYLVVIDFDTLADLQVYLRHPAHEELGARFNQSLQSGMVYDFEMSGIENLAQSRFFEKR